MMPATLMSPALSKEIRGLLPIWAACMAALAGALVSRSDGLLMDAAIAAYIVGPIALGADAARERHQKTLEEIFISTLQPLEASA